MVLARSRPTKGSLNLREGVSDGWEAWPAVFDRGRPSEGRENRLGVTGAAADSPALMGVAFLLNNEKRLVETGVAGVASAVDADTAALADRPRRPEKVKRFADAGVATDEDVVVVFAAAAVTVVAVGVGVAVDEVLKILIRPCDVLGTWLEG